MEKRQSLGAYAMAAAVGVVLFFLTTRLQGGGHLLSDLLFSLASGALIVGLCRLLSNLRMFASFSWGVRMLKRLVTGEARSGREETEDYLAYRRRTGGHGDAVPLIVIAAVLFVLSLVTAGL